MIDTDRDRILTTHESRVATLVDALTPREKVLLVALASMGAASSGDSLAAMLGAVEQKVLAEPAHLGGQEANASTGSSDRADSAAPSVPVERPPLVEAEVSPLASASTPPRDDDDEEALDSGPPVRTLAERMRDEADEEMARRDRAAADAKRRAALARTVTVPQVGAAKRRAS